MPPCKKRTLRKLIGAMPENMREGWRFDASEIGRPYNYCYGISNIGRGLTGIHVETSTSFRQDSYRDEVTMNEKKLGNIMAAFVATADPSTVTGLLDEIDDLEKNLGDKSDKVDLLTDTASDLVDTCKDLLKYIDENGVGTYEGDLGAMEKLRAVIAKAEAVLT